MSDLNVSDVLAEANTIYNEINEETQIGENIDAALEVAEEIGDSVQGLTTESLAPNALRILKMTLESATGINIVEHTDCGIKLESAATQTQTKFVLESVKGIVRDFWIALKNSFNAIWARLKSWYVTMTSASESLSKKAIRIRDQAEKTTGSPTETTFEFKGYRSVHIGGKVSPLVLRGGLDNLKKITDSVLNVRTTNEIEQFISAAESSLEDFIKSSSDSADASWVNRFADLYTPSVGIASKPVNMPQVKAQFKYDDANADYKMTDTLPGDKAIVYSELKSSSTLAMDAKLGLIYARFVSVTEKPLNAQAVKAETLGVGGVLDICDKVIEMNEVVGYYEKAWDRRSKFMSRVLKELDRTIDKIDKEDVAEAKASIYKTTTRSILSAIKRSNTFNASVLNNVLATCNGSLQYCEASLAMFKKAA